MAIFTVHVPAGAPDAARRADGATFVRDGFSRGAFLFGPLYFLRHRAWIAAALWIVGVVALGAVAHALRLPFGAQILLAVLVMLFTGLEASTARRLALHRRGLDVAGLVSARSLEEGERVFFAAAEPPRAAAPAPAGASSAARPVRPPASGVIGLFPDAEG